MIKNVYKYFFLTTSLLIFTPHGAQAHVEDEPIITETAIIEEVDDETPYYDHLDYYADHLPETVEQHSYVPKWVKRLLIGIINQLINVDTYISKKWNSFKHSLPL